MSATPLNRRAQQQALRNAGDRLMKALIADSDLVEALALEAIEQKVAAGELLRAEQLRIGPGFEMNPIGTVAGLQDAIDEALDILHEAKVDLASRVTRASAVLEATIPHDGTDDGDEPPADEPEPDVADAPAEPAPEVADEPDPEVEAEAPAPRRHRPAAAPAAETAPAPVLGRPAGMPEMDRTYECEGVDVDGDACGAMVPGPAAQLSFTRFRKKLCADCTSAWDPRAGRTVHRPDPDPEPEVAQAG